MLSRAVFGIPLSRKQFRVADISNLRVLTKAYTDEDGSPYKVDSLAFDAGGKTVIFFRNLDPAEGQTVCDRLAQPIMRG